MSRTVEFLLKVQAQGFSAQMKAAADSFKRDMDSISSSAKSAGGKVKSGLAQADGKELKDLSSNALTAQGSLSGLTTRILGMAAAYVSVRGVISGVMSAITTGGEFERLNVQLNSVMGSAQGGEQAFAWIKKFTAETPYQLEDVTKGFVKLKAFGLDPMDGSYQAIADAASKLGGSQETLGGIALAVGQAWTKQKLQGQEIMQMAERGIPVWDLLSKAMGKSVPELMGMSEAGELGRKEIKLLLDELGRWGSGASVAQMSTWTGMVSNAKDVVAEFYNEISQAGALDYFKGQIKAGIDEIKRMKEDGRLAEWAAGISDAIVLGASSIKSLVVSLVEWRTEIGSIAAAMAAFKMASWVQGIATAAGALQSLFAAGAAATLALTPLAVAFAAGTAAIAGYGLYAHQQVQAAREQEKASMDLAKAVTGLGDAQRQLNDMGYGDSKAAASIARMKELGVQLARAKQLVGADVDTSAYTKAVEAAQQGFNQIKQMEDDLATAKKQHTDAIEAKRKAALDSMAAAERLFTDDVKALSGEALDKKIADAEKELETTRNKLRQALQEEQRAKEKLTSLEAGRAAQAQSIEDQIREIKRRGMTEEAQQADIAKQAKEKLTAAQMAMYDAVASGSPAAIEAARKLAGEARSAFTSLKDDKGAADGIKKVGQVLDDLSAAEIEAAKKSEAAAAEKSKNLAEQVTQLEGLVAAAKEKVVINMDANITAALGKIDEVQAKLDELKDKTITITTKTVEAHSGGGPVMGFLRGGRFPGFGGGDRIPVFAEMGEWFINKFAVRKYGDDTMSYINSGKADPDALRAAIFGLRRHLGGPVLPRVSSFLNNIHLPAIPPILPLRLATGGPVQTHRIEFGPAAIESNSPAPEVEAFIDQFRRAAMRM